MTDEGWKCLNRARRGDEHAWRELIDEYNPYLMKIGILILKRPETAKDLVQETFAKILSVREQHQSGSLKAYLSRIIWNLAVKETRKHLGGVGLEEIEIVDESPSALELIVAEERQKAIASAIGKLKPKHREILALRFYGEHSYEEIASITDIPLGTVKSRMFHAVKECRNELKDKDIFK